MMVNDDTTSKCLENSDTVRFIKPYPNPGYKCTGLR